MNLKYGNRNGQWKHGLCKCGGSCKFCCMVSCLGPVTFAMNAKSAGLGSGLLWLMADWCSPCSSCWARTIIRGKVREIHDIPGSCCKDCCVTFWCGPCTTCQDAAQLGSMNPAYSVISGKVQPITDQPL